MNACNYYGMTFSFQTVEPAHELISNQRERERVRERERERKRKRGSDEENKSE